MDGEFSTKNIHLAAFLYLHESLLISAIDQRGFEHFVFEDKDGCARRLAEEFMADAAAPAMSYSKALTQLRKETVQARRAR
jgi:hypothetical protein